MTDSSLAIETRIDGGCTVISLAGDLDLDTVPALEQALNACTDGLPVIVDISELDFILSAGLHVLMAVGATGKPAALVYKPHGNIARVLEIVQAHKQVPLYEELPEALRKLGDDHGPITQARSNQAAGRTRALTDSARGGAVS
jgi:anti-anti-sigma factor